MGEVYLAHDMRLGRRIALKLLSPELTLRAEGVRRFQQEARTASALNHPNTLTIYEIGEAGALQFIATRTAILLRSPAGTCDSRMFEDFDMEPKFAPAHWFPGQAYEQLGNYNEAIRQLQQAVNYSGGRALMLGSLGYTYAVSGHETEAHAVLRSLQDESRHNVPALTSAFIYAGLGQNDAAFEWLDKAYEERFGWLIFLKVDPKFDNLRSDPRFMTLLQRLKLK